MAMTRVEGSSPGWAGLGGKMWLCCQKDLATPARTSGKRGLSHEIVVKGTEKTWLGGSEVRRGRRLRLKGVAQR